MAMPSARPTKTMLLPKVLSFSARAPMAALALLETAMPEAMPERPTGEGGAQVADRLGPVGGGGDGRGGLGGLVGGHGALGQDAQAEEAEDGEEADYVRVQGLFSRSCRPWRGGR